MPTTAGGCVADVTAKEKIHPEGFEPPTPGSEDLQTFPFALLMLKNPWRNPGVLLFYYLDEASLKRRFIAFVGEIVGRRFPEDSMVAVFKNSAFFTHATAFLRLQERRGEPRAFDTAEQRFECAPKP
jgi:hypothetical protein